MARKKPMFLRTDYDQYSKLGFRRKKKLVYRKAKGQGNKQRLKMKGHLRNISIGYRTEKKKRDLVNGLKIIMIRNVDDLKNLKQGEVGQVIKMGDKKKIEIAEYAFKHTIKLHNLNSGKFLDKIKEKRRLKQEQKSEKDKKKKEKEKKSVEKEKETKETETNKEEKTEKKENLESETKIKTTETKKEETHHEPKK